MTLGDYFLLVLRSPTAQQGLGWEQLNIFNSGLPAFATGAPTLPYQATFDVRPEFTREECPKRIAEILMGAPSEWNPVKEWEEDRKKHCAYWTCGPLFVAWFWDGDHGVSSSR